MHCSHQNRGVRRFTNPPQLEVRSHVRSAPAASLAASAVRTARTCQPSGSRQIRAAASADTAKTAKDAELESNKKRWEESGGSNGSVDDWRWTLNWDEITPDIVVGSCPRSPADLEKLVAGTGATAVLCLQSDACMEAMQIDWGAIREHGVQRDVLMVRVAVRDFDHFDQTVMLPEAVKVVATLLSMGKRVYVHCTAGINRAALVTVGYLTFFQGVRLDDALKLVKSKRPQVHPYVDCWKAARARALEGCTDAVARRAKLLWHRRKEAGRGEDGMADWVEAEDYVVRQLFQRSLSCSLSLVSSIKDLQDGQMVGLACVPKAEMEVRQQELARVGTVVLEERRRLREALAELSIARMEIEDLRHGVCSVDLAPDPGVAMELAQAQATLEATKNAMRQIFLRSQAALSGSMSLDEADSYSTSNGTGYGTGYGTANGNGTSNGNGNGTG